MKTTIISILTLFLMYSTSYTQEETKYGFNKSDFIVAGSISYSKGDSNSKFMSNDRQTFTSSSENKNFSLIPEVGYFLSDYFMIGTKIGYITGKSKNYNGNILFENKSSGYTASLFGRYYVIPKKRISLFTELEGSYSKIDSKNSRNEFLNLPSFSENKQESYSISFAPGVNIFINQNLALTSKIGNIGYTRSKNSFIDLENNDTSNNKNSGFSASVNLDNFFFGFLYTI